MIDRDRPVGESLAGSEITLPSPGFAAVRHPGRTDRVYVSHYDDDAVSALDLAAGAVEWTAATPARPFEPLPV